MSGWYCVRLKYDSDQLCMTKLDGNGRCDKRHASGHGGCCEHGFELCIHGVCEIECDDRACDPSLDHEYACICDKLVCDVARDLRRGPCHGECGCQGCGRAYSDFMDLE